MRKNITSIYYLMVILIVWHNADATTTNTPEKETDSNRSISPIVQILDQNLLGMNGEAHRRTKQYVGLCILADWCPASRSFARHVSDFHDLFGDEVTLVLINPGKRSDWFFGRYRIPWTTVRASAVAPLLEQLQIKHAPKFILMDEKGTYYDRRNWHHDFLKL